jgi:hypothetical protein
MKHFLISAGLLLIVGCIAPASPASAQNLCTYVDGGAKVTCTPQNRLPVDATGTVSPPTPATVVAGQYKITASAHIIGTGALVNGVAIKAKSSNSGAVWVGGPGVTVTDDGTGNGYRLLPGEPLSFAVSNLNGIYAVGTANDVIYFEGN